MDYGHTQNHKEFELDQLNLDSNEMFWEHGVAPARDSRALGNKVISTPGKSPETTNISEANNFPDLNSFPKTADTPEALSPASESHGQLGQIVNLEMPPATHENFIEPEQSSKKFGKKASSDVEILSQALSFSIKDIKTEDKLDPRAVKVVDDAIHKLGQDGNIADFYDAARGMMETNLENSYNRKLAA